MGKKGDKWGLINNYGSVVAPFDFSTFRDFVEGMAAVGISGRMGFINTSGIIVVPVVYDYVSDFQNSVAVVAQGGLFGLINKQNAPSSLAYITISVLSAKALLLLLKEANTAI